MSHIGTANTPVCYDILNSKNVSRSTIQTLIETSSNKSEVVLHQIKNFENQSQIRTLLADNRIADFYDLETYKLNLSDQEKKIYMELHRSQKARMSSEELAIVKGYTSNGGLEKQIGYYEINSFLRGILRKSDFSESQIAEAANRLKNLVMSAGLLVEGTLLFRGLGLRENNHLEIPPVGAKFEEKGFLSTTLDATTAYNFLDNRGKNAQRIIMILEVGPGGLPAYLVGQNYEKEVILPPQIQLTVQKHFVFGNDHIVVLRADLPFTAD